MATRAPAKGADVEDGHDSTGIQGPISVAQQAAITVSFSSEADHFCALIDKNL
jgi:hypothetical protein